LFKLNRRNLLYKKLSNFFLRVNLKDTTFNTLMEYGECVVCGKHLIENEKDVCETCFNLLKLKYCSTKLKKVIKWHKKQTKKLKQE